MPRSPVCSSTEQQSRPHCQRTRNRRSRKSRLQCRYPGSLMGALTPLVLALNLNTFMRTSCGELDTATSLVAELNAVREATGTRMASYGAGLLAAYQGHPLDLSPQVAAVENELLQSVDGFGLQVASLATAVLNNGLGRYTEAIAAAQPGGHRRHARVRASDRGRSWTAARPADCLRSHPCAGTARNTCAAPP